MTEPIVEETGAEDRSSPINVAVAPEGAMIVVGHALSENIRWISSVARELGLVFPSPEVVFRAGQVFFDGGQPAEVRISLLYRDPSGRLCTFTRTRNRDGHEQGTGPTFMYATPSEGGVRIAETDRGRCHVTAVVVDPTAERESEELALVWDLRQRNAPGAPPMMRVPQGVLLAASSIRSGKIESMERAFPARDTFPIDDDMRHWTVIPREGTTLVLPFTDASGVTVSASAGEARLVLSGGMLLTYLTTWALWASMPDPAGRFLVNTRHVAELRGFTAHGAGRNASFGRPMQDFRSDLDHLTCLGIKATREIKGRTVEPMIQRYEVTRGGTYYRHAPILIDTIQAKGGEPGGFAQVPVRACRLSAHDAPTAVGLAGFWRAKIVEAALASDAPGVWRGSLRTLADELGIFRANEARKNARAYWIKLAEDIARVMHQGDFGEAHISGEGPEAVVTLEPSPGLAGAYVALREARTRARLRADAAEQEAAVRRRLPQKLPPARRPRSK